MTTETESKTYYKLIFATSIKTGDRLRILEWRKAHLRRGHWDKDYPAGWYPVWGTVDTVRRFGSSVIVHYSRPSMGPGERLYGTTLYYPKQYACLILAHCRRQPETPT